MIKIINKTMTTLKHKKIFYRSLIFIGAIIFLLGIVLFYCDDKKELEVSFFDVGQGDSSLIKTPGGKIILIDGGPDNLVLRRLGEKLPFYKRKIDLIIISHYHDDHITGLIEIMRRYQVDKLIYSANAENSFLSEILFSDAKENKIELIAITKQANLDLGDNCSILLINPLSLKIKANANNSLIAKLDCGANKLLFSGDNELAVEKALLASKFNLKADVFKASHHGSKTSNTLDFLKMINPSKIIISVGIDNRFGHPSSEVLESINSLGIEVFRTDLIGTIDIFSNIK